MYELKRILVPTDFSRHADDALEHAMDLGERYNAEITLLHVDEFSVSPMDSEEIGDESIAVFRERVRQCWEDNFERLRSGMEGRRIRGRTLVLPGRSYKVIVEEAEEQAYDMVVMATRGRTHLSSYLIGSTVERVVRLSRQPVLSIRNAPKRKSHISSILCPTDFSPAGNVALSYALSIARQHNATLYVHYISEVEHGEPRSEILQRAPRLGEHHPHAEAVKVEYVFDRDVEPSNSIIRFAEDRDVELIVMSTHGRRGLRRVYIGNNTAEVVRQSTRPVLTVTHPFHKKVFATPVTTDPRVPL
jgi:nucleotide-binding universal stress UspA family protein